MEFKVRQFAQIMLLSHGITLLYDEISGGSTMIDLYEIIDRPNIVVGKVLDYMKLTFDRAMLNDDAQDLYERLTGAKNDELFLELLKMKNEFLRNGIVIK